MPDPQPAKYWSVHILLVIEYVWNLHSTSQLSLIAATFTLLHILLVKSSNTFEFPYLVVQDIETLKLSMNKLQFIYTFASVNDIWSSLTLLLVELLCLWLPDTDCFRTYRFSLICYKQVLSIVLKSSFLLKTDQSWHDLVGHILEVQRSIEELSVFVEIWDYGADSLLL